MISLHAYRITFSLLLFFSVLFFPFYFPQEEECIEPQVKFQDSKEFQIEPLVWKSNHYSAKKFLSNERVDKEEEEDDDVEEGESGEEVLGDDDEDVEDFEENKDKGVEEAIGDDDNDDGEEEGNEVDVDNEGLCDVINRSRKYDKRCHSLEPKFLKKLLITGTGRTGTHWMSGKFNQMGLDLKHERIGANGSVSWIYAYDDLHNGYPWGCFHSMSSFSKVKCRIGKIKFEKVFHQVRFPLIVMASMTTYRTRSWDFISKVEPFPFEVNLKKQKKETISEFKKRVLKLKLRMIAYHWMSWNLFVEKIADYRYRIEEANPEDICRRAGYKADCRIIDNIPEPYNFTRNHIDLTWEMLEDLDPVVTKVIQEMTLRYGYDLDYDDYAKRVGGSTSN